ncbi:hypothetical protein B0H14DRAFT_2661674 [Mycena olivaceomarginata]|nr:hypothetical protein B0H14DRAFT_2661674 [Mycena olivaceomarginata]
MALLLDLPNELLTLILLCLLCNRDLETSTNLSRASRRLRFVADPLTSSYLCLKGAFGSYRLPMHPDTREAAFIDLYGDARAAAVRYLKVTGHIEDTGIELLGRLQNVTHLEISGAWWMEYGTDCFDMVYALVRSFPALRYLHLTDCYQEDEDFDEFQDNLQEDPTEYTGRNAYDPTEIISNSLRHIVCENVDPAFRKLWLSTPAIDISEKLVLIACFFRDPVFRGKVKRFHVEHRLVDKNADETEDYNLEWLLQDARDAENLHSFFQWRAHVLPCLQELILEVPFYLEHLPDILAALPEMCPVLKRLKFEMSPRGYRDFIDHGRNSLLKPTHEFQFLEEIRLPFTGLNCDLVTTLPCFFVNSPMLMHIYLSNPQMLHGEQPSKQALLACAEGYAAAVHTLRSVSWDRHATIEVGAGTDTEYKIRSFQKSCWEERRGITGWWQ